MIIRKGKKNYSIGRFPGARGRSRKKNPRSNPSPKNGDLSSTVGRGSHSAGGTPHQPGRPPGENHGRWANGERTKRGGGKPRETGRGPGGKAAGRRVRRGISACARRGNEGGATWGSPGTFPSGESPPTGQKTRLRDLRGFGGARAPARAAVAAAGRAGVHRGGGGGKAMAAGRGKF